MAPTTPSGSRKIMCMAFAAVFVTEPSTLSIHSAMKRIVSATSGTSTLSMSEMGLPMFFPENRMEAPICQPSAFSGAYFSSNSDAASRPVR